MTETIEDIAYDEAVRALAQQYQALANLRARAGTVVAGAALVASFLGAPALRTAGHDAALGVGLLALLGALALCGSILWPYAFKFRLSPRTILEDHAAVPKPTELARLKGYLALKYEDHHEQNEDIIARLHNALAIALLCLGVETFALLAAVRPL